MELARSRDATASRDAAPAWVWLYPLFLAIHVAEMHGASFADWYSATS